MAFAHEPTRAEAREEPQPRDTDRRSDAGSDAVEPEAPEEMVRAFVRAHPAACLIGSAVIGYVAARIFRASDS